MTTAEHRICFPANRHMFLSVTFLSVRHLCAERWTGNATLLTHKLSRWQNFLSDLWSRQPSLACSPSLAASSTPDLICLAHLHLDVWLLSLFEALARDASQAVTSAVRENLSAQLTSAHPRLSFPSSRSAKYVFVGNRCPCNFLCGFVFFFFPLAGDIWLITRNHLSA